MSRRKSRRRVGGRYQRKDAGFSQYVCLQDVPDQAGPAAVGKRIILRGKYGEIRGATGVIVSYSTGSKGGWPYMVKLDNALNPSTKRPWVRAVCSHLYLLPEGEA